MAIVIFSSELQKFTGEAEVRVDARDYRSMIDVLLARFPALKHSQFLDMVCAIDGEIIVDPLLEPLKDETEVHFFHFVAGG